MQTFTLKESVVARCERKVQGAPKASDFKRAKQTARS